MKKLTITIVLLMVLALSFGLYSETWEREYVRTENISHGVSLFLGGYSIYSNGKLISTGKLFNSKELANEKPIVLTQNDNVTVHFESGPYFRSFRLKTLKRGSTLFLSGKYGGRKRYLVIIIQ